MLGFINVIWEQLFYNVFSSPFRQKCFKAIWQNFFDAKPAETDFILFGFLLTSIWRIFTVFTPTFLLLLTHSSQPANQLPNLSFQLTRCFDLIKMRVGTYFCNYRNLSIQINLIYVLSGKFVWSLKFVSVKVVWLCRLFFACCTLSKN